jgi:hypothetical protein
MLEPELAQLKQDLARIDKMPPDWRTTPIANWGKNGLANEAARLLEPSWWQRSETPAAAAIQNLFRRYERDDEEETEAEKKARRQRAAEGHGPGRENVEADGDDSPAGSQRRRASDREKRRRRIVDLLNKLLDEYADRLHVGRDARSIACDAGRCFAVDVGGLDLESYYAAERAKRSKTQKFAVLQS